MIYLDSAATTQISDSVFNAMLPWLRDGYGNPGSSHRKGREALEAVEKARTQVAGLFHAAPENIVFTSGGSEGNNFAILNAAEQMRAAGKHHIIVSSVEHDSVLRAAESLTKYGFYITYLPVCSGGSVRIETLKEAVTPETGLVSIMYVNNETGAINLIDEISEFCEENDIIFHTDCVQAAGFLDIDVNKIKCDFATMSAHKIYGPKGVGCVYVKNPERCVPLINGGHSQELGLRGGTENVHGIVGLGQAAENALASIEDARDKIWSHRALFWDRLVSELGESISLNGQWLAPSKILNIRFDGIDASSLMLLLDNAGICVSTGSACRSHELSPSRTLKAMGLTDDEASSSIRFSFSHMVAEDDVSSAATMVIWCVRALRRNYYDFEE